MKDFCTLGAYCLMHSNVRYCEYYYSAQTVYWRNSCSFFVISKFPTERWYDQHRSHHRCIILLEVRCEQNTSAVGRGVVLFAVTGSVILAAYASPAGVINFHLLQSEKYFSEMSIVLEFDQCDCDEFCYRLWICLDSLQHLAQVSTGSDHFPTKA